MTTSNMLTAYKNDFNCALYNPFQRNNSTCVEVFKTNVQTLNQAIKLKALLLHYFPGYKINFDLEDCDKILRIETPVNITQKVITIMLKQGISCEELK